MAPAHAASCTPAIPTPPAAPVTRTRSPRASPPWVNSASWAVANTSGKPPASGQPMAGGTAMAAVSSTTATVACPPPPTSPITRSPGANRVTPSPTAVTVPASSMPGTSRGQPGGAG